MKKKVFFGTLAAMIFSIHISAFAAPTAAFGDVSAGNHIAAPYAKSDIIVPRPSASKYAALQICVYRDSCGCKRALGGKIFDLFFAGRLYGWECSGISSQ